MSNSLEENLLDAIDILVTNAVEKAEFDRTIQATIISCVEASLGKYKCKYMDSTFYAYSDSIDTTYPDGTSVYVTVPNGDMSAEKLIIGTVKKLGTNYVSDIEPEDYYDKVGTNVISSSSTFELCSYIDKTLVLYDEEGTNLINVDLQGVEEYIKESSSLIVGATIKTTLPTIQQFKGNYGVTFTLAFENDLDGTTFTRDYTLDVDNMTGNPYKYLNATRQYVIYDIDSPNFKGISKIAIFNKDFPEQDSKKKVNDIFISNIELIGAVSLESSALSGTSITFITPNGTFFDESNSLKEKTIQAQVKVKGKIVDPDVQGIKFYWYREDVSITPASVYYNKQGGRGWKCLNEYNVLQLDDSGSETVVDWVSASDTFKLTIDQATAKENKIKCVINYDGSYISKIITIKNLSASAPELIITSDSGTSFYYDRGNPTLTCEYYISGEVKDLASDEFECVWAIEDENGSLSSLPETYYGDILLGDAIVAAQEEVKKIEDALAAGEVFVEELNATQALVKAQNRLTELQTTQNVYKNKITSVDISQINGYATYKCSVFKIDPLESEANRRVYQGTASITLTNSYSEDSTYRLVINNGHQMFKYDEDGISPCSPSLDNPQEIQSLSYTFYDDKGVAFTEEELKGCEVKWKVPIKDTLLSISSSNGDDDIPDETQSFRYIKNATNLIYSIANKYDFDKTSNDIELSLVFKGTTFTATTSFIFLKEGESGSNGTAITCKIVPCTNDANPPKIPVVSVYTGYGTGELNYTLKNNNNTTTLRKSSPVTLFEVELWKNGERIFKGSKGIGDVNSDEGIPVYITWDLMKNKYSTSVTDDSNFNCYSQTDGTFMLARTFLESGQPTTPANLVQCTVTYDGVTYYDVMPIVVITDLLYSSTSLIKDRYKIKLKENSGFKSVMYSSDGLNPQYASSPFEIQVLRKTEPSMSSSAQWYLEDVSTTEGEYAVNYTWNTLGSIKVKEGTSYVDKNEDTLEVVERPEYLIADLAKNQKRIKPAATYTGECVNSAVTVTVTGGTSDDAYLIGHVHIPVYLYLNRYGMAALNGWDGNSIQIDEEGGFILSPQVGAGKKDTSNRFTGVLMGEVKEANRSTSDIGLIGYSEGQKSFFIDSETGIVQLGKKNSGRIIADPSNKKAMLYSDNFWKEYDSEKGLPKSYEKTNYNTEGMLIDLTTPEIRFGSGNFSVDENGSLTSTSGKIGDFNITQTSLYSGNKKTWESTNEAGVYIGPEGVCIGSNFWIYATEQTDGWGTKNHNPGDLYARGGTIGGWTISQTALYSGSKSTFDSSNSGVYLAKDGFALGNNFKVTSDGKLTAKSGTIANWTIGQSELYTGSHDSIDSSNSGMYIGQSGISLGAYNTTHGAPPFKVTSDGTITARKGKIAGWDLSSSGLSYNGGKWTGDSSALNSESFYLGTEGLVLGKNMFWVDNTGSMFARSGTIGGWTIGSAQLSGGSMWLKSEGSCGGKNWNITSEGKATFNDIECKGKITATSGSIGGLSSAILPNGNTYVGSTKTSLASYVESLVVNYLNANTIQVQYLTQGDSNRTWDGGATFYSRVKAKNGITNSGSLTQNGNTTFDGDVTIKDANTVYLPYVSGHIKLLSASGATYSGYTGTVGPTKTITLNNGLITKVS
jgi:hypothetical protein